MNLTTTLPATRALRLILAAVIALLAVSCTRSCQHVPGPADISPNDPNGTPRPFVATAGLTYELAGDEQTLYAVSLDAGIWRAFSGQAWESLLTSPQFATTIAVDPTNRLHLVVGERNGNATPVELNHTGLWESFNAGNSWLLTYSPATAPCNATNSLAIPAVQFRPDTGTLFIGTPCGLGRRGMNNPLGAFTYVASQAGAGLVQAFALSHPATTATRVWATSSSFGQRLLLWSDDDGNSWNRIALPQMVDGYGVGAPSRGGEFTLAAYGRTAILDFRPTDASQPGLWAQGSNFITLLLFDESQQTFHVQPLQTVGDGTGLGGRHRLRSFPSVRGAVGAYPEYAGAPHYQQTYLEVGQDVLRISSINSVTQMPVWESVAETNCSGCPHPEPLHADIWDVHVASDSGTLRIAGDGGVYRKAGSSWDTQNDGLHTHHVHSIVAVRDTTLAHRPPHLAYTVTDNSEWYSHSDYFFPLAAANPWKTYSLLGDGSFALADEQGPAVAYLVRHSSLATATDFDLGMPEGIAAVPGKAVTTVCKPSNVPGSCTDFTLLGSRTFTVIQSTPYELIGPSLDVVMLADLPLEVSSNGTVAPITAGPLAGIVSSTGAPVLLRNRNFLKQPDSNLSQYSAWELVADDLPVHSRAVWVSGGRVNPVYYVLADGPTTTGAPLIYRRAPRGGWFALQNVGAAVLDPSPNPIYGPLFVNPYNPNDLFILTADGVRKPAPPYSSDITQSSPFELEPVLTALITQSGLYPLDATFTGGNGTDVVWATQANSFPKLILGQMSFDPAAAHRVAVVSPVAGVFYQDGRDHVWQTMNEWLPLPFTMPSTIAALDGALYVGFEGRSVWSFSSPGVARIACYFGPAGPGGIRVLFSATTLPVPSVPIAILTTLNGTDTQSTISTDYMGRFPVSAPAGSTVHLKFAGNDDVAACETAFQMPQT